MTAAAVSVACCSPFIHSNLLAFISSPSSPFIIPPPPSSCLLFLTNAFISLHLIKSLSILLTFDAATAATVLLSLYALYLLSEKESGKKELTAATAAIAVVLADVVVEQ